MLLNSLNLPVNPNKKTEKDRVENLLLTEIFEIPQSLSTNQYFLYDGMKLHVTSEFRTISKPSFHLMKNGIVIELSMILCKEKVSSVKSFEDSARFLYHVILKSAEPYNTFDIVTDIYFSETLKEGVRDSKVSKGLIFNFNDFTAFPTNIETDFLTNVTNKTNLNE